MEKQRASSLDASRPRRRGRRAFLSDLAAATVAGLVGGPLLAACAGAPPTGTPDRPPAAATAPPAPATRAPAAAPLATAAGPRPGGALTIALANDIVTLDPARYADVYSGPCIRQLADTLVRYTPDLRPVPGLARRWEISPDGTQYTFHLQPGVTFHDGTACDAEAVKFSLGRVMKDATSPWHEDLADVREIAVVDPLTLRVTLNRPFAPFISRMSLGGGIVLSPTAVGKLGDRLGRDFTGAGSGPWRFESWQKGDGGTFVRNESYWERDPAGARLPYVDRLVFKVVPNPSTRLAHLRTGEVDALTSYLGSPPPQDVAALRQDPSLVYQEEPGLSMYYLELNTRRPPFDRKEVRQALAHAIDRPQVVQTVLYGLALPNDTVVPPAQLGGDPGEHPYLRPDLARARALLQGAGLTRAGLTVLVDANIPANVQILELIKDQIAPAGFDLTIEPVEFAALQARQRKGDFQVRLSWWSGLVDPDGNTYPLFHSKGGWNGTGYANPAVDQVLERGRQLHEPAARAAVYREANRVLADDSPFVVLYNGLNSAVARRSVRNFPLGTASIARYAEVWKSA